MTTTSTTTKVAPVHPVVGTRDAPSDTRLAPQVFRGSPNAPLENLVAIALRRFGDFSSRRVTGDVVLMMIEFANEVVEMVNSHPYNDSEIPVEYYTSQTDIRPVEDAIMVRGLLALYAEQQVSDKYPNSRMEFARHLNGILYSRKYKGTVRHEMTSVENTDPMKTMNGTESSLAI